MTVEGAGTHADALDSVTRIVSAYLERSSGLSPEQVIDLVQGLVNVLTGGERPAPSSSTSMAASPAAAAEEAAPAEPVPPRKPAVPIEESVQPDYLVCLEDGKKLKLLKRYLASQFGLTPAQYRQRWGLPKDYPVVAPSYSARRVSIARASGLGTRRGKGAAPVAAAPAETAAPAKVPGKRGRKRLNGAETAPPVAAAADKSPRTPRTSGAKRGRRPSK